MAEKARTVRPYLPEDAAVLVQIHNQSYPASQIRPNVFPRYLNDVLNVGGQVWVILEADLPVGYAYLVPVPGLEGTLDLQGCITPSRRREGFGYCLLKTLISELEKNGRCQLSHAVHSLNSPAAHFLQHHQFFVEHIEVQLQLDNPPQLAPVLLPPGFRLATYPLGTAVKKFRQAYDIAFQGLPWYQPYTTDEEITAELDHPNDLLFLLDGDKTAGFVWLQMPAPDLGEIEPFGLLPAYRGQGLGEKFLTIAVQKLVAKGSKHVLIGTWQQNERALHLYQRLGFRQINSQTYLAYNIE